MSPRIRAQRSVEVAITLSAQEASDLSALLGEAAESAMGTELEGFYFDLRNAIEQTLADEGIATVQPRLITSVASWKAGGAGGGSPTSPMTHPTTIVVPVVPEPKPDPEAKPAVFDAREAANMEPRQGMKPIFK
jgi:hypothetical protein